MNSQEQLKQSFHLLHLFPGFLPVFSGIQQLQTHMLTTSCSHYNLRSRKETHEKKQSTQNLTMGKRKVDWLESSFAFQCRVLHLRRNNSTHQYRLENC